MKVNLRKVIVKTLIVILLITINVFFQILEVKETSMAPTLNEKDIVLLRKSTDLKKIKRNDILAINFKDELNDLVIIKRVIGKEGDIVEIKNDIFFINGKKLDTPYIVHRSDEVFIKYKKIVLGEEEIFVIGDNQVDSYDSRYFGPININNVKGKVLFRIFPFKN